MMYKLFVFASSIALVMAVAGCANNTGDGCAMPCLDSQICCDGECVFFMTDSRHCGTCNNACPGACSGGMCTAPQGDAGPGPSMCSSCDLETNRCCGTNCVPRAQPLNIDGRPTSTEDPRSPFNNCNGCGLRCDPTTAISCSVRPGGGETPECACGEFRACPTGELCVNDGGRYQCINTSNNPNHCGEIGRACAPGETCTAGVCGCGGVQCSDTQACCGGTCIDISSDPMNCGGCGNLCTPNAPNCVGGTCVCEESGRVCDAPTPGSIFGGGSPGESCCPGRGCVANTDTDCGCMACPSDEMCVVGGSGFPGMGGGTEIPTVCCGDELTAILGCGGFPFPFPGADGGGFPFPGGDGGFPLPGFDGGIPLP